MAADVNAELRLTFYARRPSAPAGALRGAEISLELVALCRAQARVANANGASTAEQTVTVGPFGLHCSDSTLGPEVIISISVTLASASEHTFIP